MNKKSLATEMRVSQSSLYYQSALQVKDESLQQKILTVWEEHPAYGHRRLALHLRCNKKRIRRVMKKFSMHPPVMRPQTLRGSASGAKHPVYENWLGKLCPLHPNICWTSDFTYQWYQGQWLYMATIIDVFSRELIGVAFSRFHNQTLLVDALHDALKTRPAPRYLHSDQGSEYCAEAYLTLVQALGITTSLSPKGKPWKNGFQESFYSQFKLELGPLRNHESVSHLVAAIYQQIHYYNHERIHLALKMPPIMFTTKHLQRVST